MSATAAHRPVVITGWGAVSSAGAGRDAHAQAFAAGGPRLQPIDRSAGYHRPHGARLGALVDSSDCGTWLPPRAARRMSPPSRYAVVAARQALEQAGLEGDLAATAVVTSTSFGPSSFTEELLRQILLDGPQDASPALFTEAVANAPAAQIALAAKARGPNLTLTQREAGPLLALARGAEEVAKGRAERALVASVDELNPILHAVLDRYGALAGSRGGDEIARPFDRDRRGAHASEGATCVVLESADEASRRGAEVLARVGPTIAGFDAAAPRVGWGRDPSTLARVLARGLERAAIDPHSIGLVAAGAAGSRAGDRLDALVLRQVWEERPLPTVLVPKAYAGEHGGALLAGTLVALDGAPLAPTPGFRHVDPSLDVVPFAGGIVPRPHRLLLSALAPGGSAAWTILETP
ncbi:MAG: beta-ketoacyl synthase N-terminal-like domain-containing protein [Acidobacteriota bacterium]